MLLITYELAGKNRDAAPLETAILALGGAARPLRTTFLVDSLLNAQQAYNLLEGNLDKAAGDRILVIEVQPDNRQGWVPKPTWDFMAAVKARQG